MEKLTRQQHLDRAADHREEAQEASKAGKASEAEHHWRLAEDHAVRAADDSPNTGGPSPCRALRTSSASTSTAVSKRPLVAVS